MRNEMTCPSQSPSVAARIFLAHVTAYSRAGLILFVCIARGRAGSPSAPLVEGAASGTPTSTCAPDALSALQVAMVEPNGRPHQLCPIQGTDVTGQPLRGMREMSGEGRPPIRVALEGIDETTTSVLEIVSNGPADIHQGKMNTMQICNGPFQYTATCE